MENLNKIRQLLLTMELETTAGVVSRSNSNNMINVVSQTPQIRMFDSSMSIAEAPRDTPSMPKFPSSNKEASTNHQKRVLISTFAAAERTTECSTTTQNQLQFVGTFGAASPLLVEPA